MNSGSCKRKCSSTSMELSAFRTKESLRELERITRTIYMHAIFLQKDKNLEDILSGRKRL